LLIESHICSGTGRSVRTTVPRSPRNPRIHAATSSTLLMVADSPISRTWAGVSMMISSHTVPRGWSSM
jgi:hypothetical protein